MANVGDSYIYVYSRVYHYVVYLKVTADENERHANIILIISRIGAIHLVHNRFLFADYKVATIVIS